MTAAEERERLVSPPETAPAPTTPSRGARWEWSRHWELWAALLVGAFLRLWQPGASQLLADQAGLMQLARLSAQHGAIPVTGIYSSINTLNPPLSVYVLLPFAWLTRDPLLALLSQECWNILGILFCYIFVYRSFGRRTAAISTILFATAGAAVDYSRLLWQQDYLPPFIALFALFAFAGGVHGRTRWLTPAVAFLTCAALLHPTATLLAPTLILALLLSPIKPRRWEYAASGLIIALLLAPTLVWELASGWVDATPFQKSVFGGSKSLDPAIFFRLYQVLGGPVTPGRSARQVHGIGDLLKLLYHTPTNTYFTPSSAFGSLGALPLLIAIAGFTLFALGWLVLTYRVFSPLRGLVSRLPAAGLSRRERAGAWFRAAWRRLKEEPRWRAALLLWVSVTLPPATMIDHSQNIYPHYLLSLFPLLFVVSGVGAVWLLDQARRLTETLARRNIAPRWRMSPVALTLAVLGLFVVAQVVESTAMVASLGSGGFTASPGNGNGYGYLLGDLRSADAQLGAIQRRQGARAVFIATTYREDAALAYTLVGEHPDRASFDAHCLVLPAADESPALVVATADDQPAQALLTTLPGVAPVASLAMSGGAPLTAYRVSAPLSPASRDVAAAPAIFSAEDGFAVRLDAVAPTTTGGVRLRWTILSDARASATPPTLRVLTRIQHPNGSQSYPSDFLDCAPQRWHSGETLYSWLSIPQYTPNDTLLVGAQTYTQSLDYGSVGPFTTLAAHVERTAPHDSAVTPGTQPAGGAMGSISSGWFEAPIAKLLV